MLINSLSRIRTIKLLQFKHERNIMYSNEQPYDKRWQNTFNYAHFAEPEENDPIGRPKPEDSPVHGKYIGSFRADFNRRFKNMFTLTWARRHRLQSPFQVYVLPISTLFFLQFWSLGLGFKGLALIPMFTFITLLNDKVQDPVCPETYLRDMIHKNSELSKNFSVDTMQTLDYSFEYQREFPAESEMPEFKNKLFRCLIRILQQ